MKIDEMFDRVLIRSGQFIMKRKNIEIDVDSFRLLVEDALAIYSKAVPYDKHYNIRIISPRKFEFTDTFDDELKRVPDWISEATPINSIGGLAFSPYGISGTGMVTPELDDPMQAPWIYRKPFLTVPLGAEYDVTACYRHFILEEIDTENTGKKLYSVPTITVYDTVFFSLLRAMFIQGIGKSRRAFTLNDLPIVMDAAEMASEGDSLLEKAMDDLQNVQKFYLPMG